MIDRVLTDAVAGGVTPGCVAMVWRAGELRYAGAHGRLARVGPAEHCGVVELDARYDLASLTKVLSTTTLVALAVGRGELELDARLPAGLSLRQRPAQSPGPSRADLSLRQRPAQSPGPSRADLVGDYRPTLRDLLEHASGLAAHREFFHAPWHLGLGSRDQLIAAVREVPPATAPRSQPIYSDLGFILLGAWLEQLGGAPLDRLFADRVAAPLGIADEIGFPGPRPLEHPRVAATEVYDAGLHDGVRQHWYTLREQAGQAIARGLVHDDNCLVMGGVAGHAGLFGTAEAVMTIARAWLERGLPGLERAANERIFELFTTPSTVLASTRRLGFDGPAPDGGGSTGDALSQRAFGHLGFTGTSVWIDPASDSIYVLLSNRVHPTREDQRIRELRRAFHGAAATL